jgi:histidinol-phosphate/aromatic aminotransferase/cobyric acid decarboxylase-like protein
MVKLDAMENPYTLPQALRREIAELVAGAAINRYPNPDAPELKARLRQTMAIPEACDVLLGNGSDEIIQIMVQALARPGAAVLAPEPTFVMYRAYALARHDEGLIVDRPRVLQVGVAEELRPRAHVHRHSEQSERQSVP